MPWKETCVMDERLRFLGEYLKKERSMSALCQEFGISRKTGYRFVHRYQLEGLWGLFNQSRAPHHHPHAVSDDMVGTILAVRERHPRWGPRWIVWLRLSTPLLLA